MLLVLLMIFFLYVGVCPILVQEVLPRANYIKSLLISEILHFDSQTSEFNDHMSI